MELKQEIKSEIDSLLKKVACKENISNFEPIFDIEEAIRGEGFTGEFFLADIRNKDTNETIHLAIKKAIKDPKKRNVPIAQIFSNEVYFYTAIYTTLNQLQIEKSLKHPFVEVAKFYCSNLEDFQEAIVFENLKHNGYVLRDTKKLLDDEHTRHIFHTYGKFHALSFALKDQNVGKYQQLVNGLWSELHDTLIANETMTELMKGVVQEAYNLLDPNEDAELRRKFEKFLKDPIDSMRKLIELKSHYKIIIHGDCWSNNMMFKYSNSSKLEGMKIVDFQLITEANPVHDLSNFFYAGASKEQFDKSDEYLKVYHNSLSTTLTELGSNPEKLYPFEQLKKDWSKHALYGLLLSLVVTKVKLIDRNDVMDLVKDDSDTYKEMINVSVNKDTYTERVRNMLLHAVKHNVI